MNNDIMTDILGGHADAPQVIMPGSIHKYKLIAHEQHARETLPSAFARLIG
jgi:hypothetical protein